MTENTQPSAASPPNLPFEALQNPGQHAQPPDPDIGVPEPAEPFPPRTAPERHRPKTHSRILPLTEAPPTLSPQERHSRKCQICRHPDREQIEEDFLMWRSPYAITREFDIREVSLYRHAHAFKLFPLRRDTMQLALDRIIERGATTEISPDAIIRAIRAQTCLDSSIPWVEPAKHFIFSTEPPPPPPLAPPPPRRSAHTAEPPIEIDGPEGPYVCAAPPASTGPDAFEPKPPQGSHAVDLIGGRSFSSDKNNRREPDYLCGDSPAASIGGQAVDSERPHPVPTHQPSLEIRIDGPEGPYLCAASPAASSRVNGASRIGPCRIAEGDLKGRACLPNRPASAPTKRPGASRTTDALTHPQQVLEVIKKMPSEKR